MALALGPALFEASGELPVEEAGAEALADGLGPAGAVVVGAGVDGAGEAEIGDAQGLGEHPAVAVVLLGEGANAGVAVAAGGVDGGLEVVEGGQREHRVAQLGVLVLVDPPETLGVEAAAEGAVGEAGARVVAELEAAVDVEDPFWIRRTISNTVRGSVRISRVSMG